MSSKACPLRYAHLVSPSASTAPPNTLPPSTTPSSAQQPVPDPSLCSILPQQQVAPPAALCDQEMVPSPPDIIALPSSSADVPPPPDMPPSVPASGPDIRYDDPRAIYDRYIAARMAWYNKLPRGSLKTNQEYRKAMGLPQRYDKTSYSWCLDYKQMGKRCTSTIPGREWTKEEMMAYLDWTRVEDERVERQVAQEMGDNPLANRRTGMKEIWKRVEQDMIDQQALYSNDKLAEDCIIVTA
ncbi:hypothetical protein FOMA001_g11999 [Fusarium oxysporum f. sp. matthiolae]|nr:hypothetical protein FOMA001_g11999 [Fusarium oxysporum f. sp. matthiolae]